MYIKNGKVKIAQTLNDVPVDEIEVADQIITLEAMVEDDWDTKSKYDCVTSNALVQKESNIYFFQKIFNYAAYDKSESEIKFAELETEKSSELYLRIGDRLHLLGDYDRNNEIQTEQIDLDEEVMYDGDEINVEIYKSIFEKNKKLTPITMKLKTLDNKYCHFMSFNLNDDNYLVFTTTHTIDLETRSWSTYQWVDVYTRDQKIHTLDEFSYYDIKKILKQTGLFYDFYFEFLDQIDSAANYDMKDYLEERKNNKTEGFDNLVLLFLPHLHYYEIEKMFKPIWIDKELKFYIYPRTIRNLGVGCLFIGDSEDGFHEKELCLKEVEENKNLYDNFRIAKSVAAFGFGNNRQGVSPYDGQIYRNGTINIKEIEKLKIYEDNEGIIYLTDKNTVTKNTYLKIKGYYVKSNDNEAEDNERIEEMLDRIDILSDLTEDEKIKNLDI